MIDMTVTSLSEALKIAWKHLAQDWALALQNIRQARLATVNNTLINGKNGGPAQLVLLLPLP